MKFRTLPGRIVVEMAKYCVFWLNMFPAKSRVSPDLSPRAIITGLEADYNKHCKLEFGSYVQTHEEHDNSMKSRTTGAIGLRPTGNSQGGYYFYSLSTARILRRKHWTELPIPDDVIQRVSTLARRGKANRGLIFGNRDNITTITDFDNDDSDDDEDFNPDDYDDDGQ